MEASAPEAKEGMENNEGVAANGAIARCDSGAGGGAIARCDGGLGGAITRCNSLLDEGAMVARCNFSVAALFEAGPWPRDERRLFLRNIMR
jgi:hypothetical protein